MGKYLKYQRSTRKKPRGVHPIWRGIGCILIVLIPFLSYGLATTLLPKIKATGKLPYGLFRHLQFPTWAYQWPILKQLVGFLAGIDNFWGLVLLFLIFLVLITGIFTSVSIILYQRIGPPRYSVLDLPPFKYKAKKYKR